MDSKEMGPLFGERPRSPRFVCAGPDDATRKAPAVVQETCNQRRNMRILSAWQAASLLALAAVSLRAPAAQAAPLVEHFSRADREAYVEAAARALGDAGSSLADKDYAVRLLVALDNPSVASGYKSSACSAAAAGLSGGDLEQIHHAISLGNGVGGCTNAKTWRASEEVAKAMKVCGFVCGWRVVRLGVWRWVLAWLLCSASGGWKDRSNAGSIGRPKPSSTALQQ